MPLVEYINAETEKIKEAKDIISDDQANKEKNAFESQEKRDESTKNHTHHIFILLIWIAFIAFSIVLLARIVHFILPTKWNWLSAEQLQGIDKIIFSGSIGGFLGKYFNRLNDDK